MIKRLVIIIFSLVVLTDHALAVSQIVTVQSMSIQPYEEVIRGFNSVCSGKPARVVLSEIPPGSFPQTVRELSPELLLAVGLSALDASISTEHPPVVYTMVLPQDIPGPGRGNKYHRCPDAGIRRDSVGAYCKGASEGDANRAVV